MQSSREMRPRRFPAPWTAEKIPGGYKALDATDQSLAYVYGRETKAGPDIANVLTPDDTGANWQLRAEWTFLSPTH